MPLYTNIIHFKGEVIFVNHGRPVDYLKIQQLLNTTESIFSGKILLVKQGRVAANEQVWIFCIFYSDLN